MNRTKKSSKFVVFILIGAMLMTIPNMPVYSAIGNYQTSSMALTANDSNTNLPTTNQETFWPAVLAVAAGVGLAVVFVVGVVDGWNSVGAAELTLASADFSNDFDRYDFEKFDN